MKKEIYKIIDEFTTDEEMESLCSNGVVYKKGWKAELKRKIGKVLKNETKT
ncbi:MAG: hypothetical protein KKB88_05925 [Nanoarchaeota archaeon]|nr:hypothetical protein [Nanoarchaeota archaeon]